MKTDTRISKYLARSGVASRRDAEKLIIAGRVSVNDVFVTDPWASICEGDNLKLDGEEVKDHKKSELFLLHKPRGVLSSSRDPRGRKTVFDLFKTPYDHLMIIGRLDYNSEGLVLLTNNGNIKRYLELPKNGFKRFYKVKIKGNLQQDFVKEIERGVTIEGVSYRPMKLELQSDKKSGVWLNILLKEGKNREIRKILNYYNIHVIRLIRVGFGPFSLNRLPIGKIKKISLSNYQEFSNFI